MGVSPSDGVPSGEYGFIITVPLLAGTWVLRKMGVLEEKEPPPVVEIVKAYWWVPLVGLPLTFLAVTKGMEMISEGRKKAAR